MSKKKKEGLRRSCAKRRRRQFERRRRRRAGRKPSWSGSPRAQQQLQEETAHLTRGILTRLQAGRATAAAAARASHDPRAQGAEHAAAGTPSGAAAESNAAEAAAAVKDLADAEQQVAQARRQAEADLAHEQLQRLDDSIKSLVDRRSIRAAEAVRLEKLPRSTSRSPRPGRGCVEAGPRTSRSRRRDEPTRHEAGRRAAYQFLLRRRRRL